MVIGSKGQMRFMHPKEMGFLLGFPGDFPTAAHLRATMCMLGQSASPLQSSWMFHHIGQILFQDTPTDPVAHINMMKEKLCFEKYHTWPVPGTCGQFHVTLHTADETPIKLWATGPTPAQSLLQASRMQLDWGQKVVLMDGSVRVPPDALLRQEGFYGPYQLLQSLKPQALTKSEGEIMLAFTGLRDFVVVTRTAGTFLFCVMHDLDLMPTMHIITIGDSIVAPDARLWNSHVLHVHGMGETTGTTFGLSLDFLHTMMKWMVNQIARPVDFVLHGWIFGSGAWTSLFGPGHVCDVPSGVTHCCCLLFRAHWILLTLRVGLSVEGVPTLHAAFWDGLSVPCVPPQVMDLISLYADAWQVTQVNVDISRVIMQHQPASCGTVMLGHFGLVIGFLDPARALDFEELHAQLVSQDQHLLYQQRSEHIGYGKDQQLLARLSAILVEHGVPPDRVEERATMGLKKVGAAELAAALDSNNPWAYLKAIGSRPHVAFHWLKADELQQKVRERAESKFKIQHKPKTTKPTKKEGQTPLWLDPAQLQVVSGTFYAQDCEVSQIPFTEVTRDASGLAFCSVAEAIPFLREGKSLSDKPLGILCTTPVPSDQIGTMNVVHLRYPAQFRGTNEPILVQGSLIQLGAPQITRGSSSLPICTLASIPTQTLRFYVFQDQWEGNWKEFSEQPVRALLTRFPSLSLCKKKANCGESCPNYHAAVDEPLDNLIMDLWARSWHKLDSKYTKPMDASYWSVLVRVPASAQLTIQGLSGHGGFYVEPRSDSGKSTDERYGMVWLGELPLQELTYKLKTVPNAIAIGRLRTKLGLRFQQAHLEEATKALKPEEPYIETQVHQIYKLYPLPYGTQKAALQKCLTDWGWMARVRQSMGGGSAGVAWEVGSSKEPPSTILPQPSGDVAITLIRTVGKTDAPPALLASANTKKFMQKAQPTATTSDPWTQVLTHGRAIHGGIIMGPAVRLLEPQTRCNSWRID